jgi:Tol biopolymer transport system component
LAPASAAGLPAVAAGAAAPARGARHAALAWVVAALAVAGAAAFVWFWPRLQPPAPVFRFQPATDVPGVTSAYWPRISPDGRSLLFDSPDTTGTERAWLLRLDETKPRLIPGSEGLQRAYWSPDGREIAFVAGDKIQRLSVAGGTPTIVCPSPGGADISWGSKGLILLDGQNTDSLRVVPAAGGELRPATRINRQDDEVGSAWPCFLPDGTHFLFVGTRPDGSSNMRLGRIGSLDSKLLGQSDGRVEYAPGGWILFVRGTSLLAQKLDVRAGRLTGQPITIVDDLRIGTGQGHFSVSRNGVLALARAAAETGNELHVADRRGAVAGAVLAIGTLGNPAFSPDGGRVLYERKGPSGSPFGDVSVVDLARGTDTRLTFTGGYAVCLQWSPDGRRFAYTKTSRDGLAKVMIGAADGLGAQDSLDATAGGVFLSQWAAAGSRFVAYPLRAGTLVAPSEGGDRAFRPILDSTFSFIHARISPDGRWVAGTLGGLPDVHVYVQSLEGPPGRWQISSAPGRRPTWTKGGSELVYEGMDGRLMAVDIDTRTGFHAGTPKALFSLPVRSFSRTVGSWACDERGERFLLITPDRKKSSDRSLEVVTDFASIVNRR